MKIRPVPTTLAGLALCTGLALPAAAQQTAVVSHVPTSAGAADSNRPDVDDAGRYLVFESEEDDLVAGDTNSQSDVFLYDRIADTLERLSISALGDEGDDASTLPTISADGALVVFESRATNLVPVDVNPEVDVFLYDRVAGTLQLISRNAFGVQANSTSREPRLSDDGHWVAFASAATNLVLGDTNGEFDVYLKDLQTGAVVRASLSTAGDEPNDDCYQLDVSGDGRFVVFETGATNLVAGDTNGARDLFLRDVQLGTLVRVSTTAAGLEADQGAEDPSLSENGRWLAFQSPSTNLVPGDTNGKTDVFVKDLWNGTVSRVSVASDGSECTGQSLDPAISPDGRYVVFESFAPELSAYAGSGSAIYVHDRATGVTELVSVATDGTLPDDTSFNPAIARDGRFVAYASSATTLDPADSGASVDVYLRDRVGGPSSYCVGKTSGLGCTPRITWSGSPSASGGSFTVDALDVDAQRNGLLFYGLNGPAELPFHGGTLCVQPPLRRTIVQSSGGAAGCDGGYAFDFADWIASGAHAALAAGVRVEAQYWYREPTNPDGTGIGLTDALDFTIEP